MIGQYQRSRPPLKCLGNRVPVYLVQVHQIEAQKLVLVPPHLLARRKRLHLIGRWGRVGDLGDEVRCGGLRNAVDQNTDKGDSDEDVEAQAKSK
jgi:hypothetical protein